MLSSTFSGIQQANTISTALSTDDSMQLMSEGISLYRNGNYTQAIEVFDRVLQIEPNNIDALMYKGLSLSSLRQYLGASAVFARVLQIEPNNMDALMYRGIAMLLRQDGAAADVFDKILRLAPGNTTALYYRGLALIYERTVCVYDCGPDYQGALQSFDQVLAIQPNNTHALVAKAVVLSKLERFSEEMEIYNNVLAMQPNNTNALYNAGIAFFYAGQYGAAIEMFDRILDFLPNNIDVLVYKGQSLWKSSQIQEAQKLFDRVVEIEPRMATPIEILREVLPGSKQIKATIQPDMIIAKLPTPIIVYSEDADTHSPVIGRIIINGTEVGNTNEPFTHTFNSSSSRAMVVAPYYPDTPIQFNINNKLDVTAIPNTINFTEQRSPTNITIIATSPATHQPIEGKVLTNEVRARSTNIEIGTTNVPFLHYFRPHMEGSVLGGITFYAPEVIVVAPTYDDTPVQIEFTDIPDPTDPDIDGPDGPDDGDECQPGEMRPQCP
jgi:tetratricopeptide (TPR) repeat protein